MKMYKQLSELGDIVTGKTPSTANNELWGGTTPFIKDMILTTKK